jgi:hypothetical protein
MLHTTEKPGVEEQYSVAGNTSDLTVEADRRGAGDVMIAAGWNESRLGMALLRLHSEWNGLAKPRRAGKQVFDVVVARIKAEEAACARRPSGTAAERAQAELDHWYVNELRLLANGLKSRASVWAQLSPWIEQKGVAPEIAAEGLLYWLHSTCKACDGHGLKKQPDAPVLSARICHLCQGTGNAPQPRGAGKLLAHLDYCVGVARHSLKKRLRPEG